MRPPAFDRVVVVDWSASSRPKRGRDSIWIAVLDGDGVSTTNPATRAAAAVALDDLCRRSGRTLLGVDFSLGYPVGTASALGLSGVPWRATWELLTALIVDTDDNTNNRFEVAAELNARVGAGPGPFWGCPSSRRSEMLSTTKVDPTPMDEWRRVERRLRRRGLRPFSSWQLLGAGSVGSQSLLGIPRLQRLERVLIAADRTVDVWPFTCVGPPTADVVIAEVWPSLHPHPERPTGRVRDELQVIHTAQRLARDLDLGVWSVADAGHRKSVRGEEGWIAGA